MATLTSQDRKIADKLSQVDAGLSAALKAIESITDGDIRSSSWADGSSLFKQLKGEITAAVSFRKRINYFGPGK